MSCYISTSNLPLHPYFGSNFFSQLYLKSPTQNLCVLDNAPIMSMLDASMTTRPNFSLEVPSWEINHPDGKSNVGHPDFAASVYDEMVLKDDNWSVHESNKTKEECEGLDGGG